jgi:hypothetical protein
MVAYCGDGAAAKRAGGPLLHDAGVESVDAGRSASRATSSRSGCWWRGSPTPTARTRRSATDSSCPGRTARPHVPADPAPHAAADPAGGRPVAVVTGGNRGIGLEVCRQLAARGYTVVLGARDAAKGEAAAAALGGGGAAVVARALDVDDAAGVAAAAAWVGDRFGRCDALVNNAAVLYDTWERALGADLDTVRAALETNTLGAWRVCQAFAPLLRAAGWGGRVVNVSSESGSLAGCARAARPRTR